MLKFSEISLQKVDAEQIQCLLDVASCGQLAVILLAVTQSRVSAKTSAGKHAKQVRCLVDARNIMQCRERMVGRGHKPVPALEQVTHGVIKGAPTKVGEWMCNVALMFARQPACGCRHHSWCVLRQLAN